MSFVIFAYCDSVLRLPTRVNPSIDSDVFAGYERGVLEIEHRVDDLRNFTYPTEGMKLANAGLGRFSARALQGSLLVLMT